MGAVMPSEELGRVLEMPASCRPKYEGVDSFLKKFEKALKDLQPLYDLLP
jgi:hypothetical protein